jgi:uncharacterized protein DUF1524
MYRIVLAFLLVIAPSFAVANEMEDADYSRKFFGSGWLDTDRDCLNTRSEILLSLSTGVVPIFNERECIVIRGKWFDAYDNKYIRDASKVDIDHIVPLKWAWEHGANTWSLDLRKQFANDLRFIIPVSSSLNRSKGAKPPTDWMPPNSGFRCQYVTIFKRAILVYDFQLSALERNALDALYVNECANEAKVSS